MTKRVGVAHPGSGGLVLAVATFAITMREFENYVDGQGNEPVFDFIRSLSLNDSNKLFGRLEDLEGIERLGRPYLKQFSGYPFWFGELILGNFRIFVHRLDAMPGEERYLLIHAFRKKSTQTPKRELAIAQRRILDYYEQHR